MIERKPCKYSTVYCRTYNPQFLTKLHTCTGVQRLEAIVTATRTFTNIDSIVAMIGMLIILSMTLILRIVDKQDTKTHQHLVWATSFWMTFANTRVLYKFTRRWARFITVWISWSLELTLASHARGPWFKTQRLQLPFSLESSDFVPVACGALPWNGAGENWNQFILSYYLIYRII